MVHRKNIELIKNLVRPSENVDVVIDTDAFNEIDDQYAIAYALKSEDKISVKAIYAAPFSNDWVDSPQIGMEKSYEEIKNVLKLVNREDMLEYVYRGSETYLESPNAPVQSEAVNDLVKRAMSIPDGKRLYVVAIGAITNVASAILIEPQIIDKIVVIWLGGNAFSWRDNQEFNCYQDVMAARVVFNCEAPVIQIPCRGVTSHLTTTEPELRHHLKGKNELCDYLYEITCKQAILEGKNRVWSKEIWDIITIAWLVGDESWMEGCLVHSPIITYDHTYSHDLSRHFILQIQSIQRDYIFQDLFNKLTNK